MVYKEMEEFANKHHFEWSDNELIREVLDILASKPKESPEKKPKRKSYHFRLNEDDMQKMRDKAEKEWMPYQTLVWSIIHKFVTWKIK
jgi:predicted DNA binding CopG/RHH family protein